MLGFWPITGHEIYSPRNILTVGYYTDAGDSFCLSCECLCSGASVTCTHENSIEHLSLLSHEHITTRYMSNKFLFRFTTSGHFDTIDADGILFPFFFSSKIVAVSPWIAAMSSTKKWNISHVSVTLSITCFGRSQVLGSPSSDCAPASGSGPCEYCW